MKTGFYVLIQKKGIKWGANIVNIVLFLSISNKERIQYTLAVDRGNKELQSLYDSQHPAILFLIKNSIDAAKRHGISCGICGEMAGEKNMIPPLIAYGLDEFSVGVSIIGEIKNAIDQQLACME